MVVVCETRWRQLTSKSNQLHAQCLVHIVHIAIYSSNLKCMYSCVCVFVSFEAIFQQSEMKNIKYSSWLCEFGRSKTWWYLSTRLNSIHFNRMKLGYECVCICSHSHLGYFQSIQSTVCSQNVNWRLQRYKWLFSTQFNKCVFAFEWKMCRKKLPNYAAARSYTAIR